MVAARMIRLWPKSFLQPFKVGGTIESVRQVQLRANDLGSSTKLLL